MGNSERKRALITGITGQDGSYLAEFLLDKGYEVIGMTRRTSMINFERIQHIQDKVIISQGDLLDQASLIDIIEENQPNEVYNLAGQSFLRFSWEQPVLDVESTGVGVTRILEAIRLVCPKARFYQASSSEMFGEAVEVPQSETTPFHPRNPYCVAKLYAHLMTLLYRNYYNLFTVSGILFNHESPRRGIEFVTRKITHGAAKIKLGLAKELRLGDIDARRDWGFASDYVEAMWMMLQYDQPEDFVISTGAAHSVRELCEVAFEHLGLDYRDYVRKDPRFVRPKESRQLVGDSSKARKLLGWKPKHKFKQFVRIMVDADLALLSDSQSKKVKGKTKLS